MTTPTIAVPVELLERISRVLDRLDALPEPFAEAAELRALLTAQQQASDSWPKLEKPARVGAGVFAAGLSARLVVEAAYRQHQYAEEPPFSDEQIKAMSATLCQPQASAAQSAPAGEREAFELASVDDNFGCLRVLGAEAERHGLEDGDYIDLGARKAWEYFQAGASWQRTQYAVVLDALREAVEYLDDNPFNEIGAGSILHRAMRDALAAAPAQPAAQREWPDDEIVEAWKWCEENGGTPAEFLSHSLLVKRSRVLGRPLTWREAIELTAITTNMPDEERDKLLAIDDEPDAATQDQGEVHRLREALTWLRGAINCTAENDVDQCGAWISTKHPMIQRIDELLAASTGQEVKP